MIAIPTESDLILLAVVGVWEAIAAVIALCVVVALTHEFLKWRRRRRANHA